MSVATYRIYKFILIIQADLKHSIAKREIYLNNKYSEMSHLVGWDRWMHIGREGSLGDHSVWSQTVRWGVEAAEQTEQSVKKTWRQPHHVNNLQHVPKHINNISVFLQCPAEGTTSLKLKHYSYFPGGLGLFSVSPCIPLTHFVRLWGHTQASFLPGKTIHGIQNQWGHANTGAVCAKTVSEYRLRMIKFKTFWAHSCSVFPQEM